MANAYAVTNEKGFVSGIELTVGTGGHGESTEIYHKTYEEVPSIIKESTLHNTGMRDGKGKIIYDKTTKETIRVSVLRDVIKISPLVYDEFSFIKGVGDNTKIKCYDLMEENKKDGLKGKYRIGFSFIYGKYKAVYILNKTQLYINIKPVRTFRGK